MHSNYQISAEQQRRFCDLLNQVDTSLLNEDVYSDRYLLHLLNHKVYYVKIYAAVLNHALQASAIQPQQLTFVDYGAGNGLLGFFAAFCNFKSVFLVDTDPSFTASAAQLQTELSLKTDGIVTGELAALKDFLKDKKPDIIAGTDVIEHIYNLPLFFEQLHELNPDLVTVFTTASNPLNPFKTKSLVKIQLRDEYEGGTPDDYLLFGEQSSKPFLEIRKEIILAKGVHETSAQLLAEATRGMMKEDIEHAAEIFIQTGKLPEKIKHPTNTCHPLTGSWSERILELEEYKSIYNQNGFSLKVIDGFYNVKKKFPQSLLMRFVNAAIPLLRHFIAPFIVLIGKTKD